MAQLSEPIIEGSSGWSNLSALFRAIATVVSLGLVASAAYVVFDTVSLYGNGIPVVQPPGGSARVPADDPGGTLVKNQGFSVNEIAGSGGAKPAPRRVYLAPPPQELADEDMGRAAPIDAVPPSIASRAVAAPSASDSGLSAPASPAASAAALEQAVSEALGVSESAAAGGAATAAPDAEAHSATIAGETAFAAPDPAAATPAEAIAAAVADAPEPVAAPEAAAPAQEMPAASLAALDEETNAPDPKAEDAAQKGAAPAQSESQMADAAAQTESRRETASGGADAAAQAESRLAAAPAEEAPPDAAAPAVDSPETVAAVADNESPIPAAPASAHPQQAVAGADAAAAAPEAAQAAPAADPRRAIRPRLRPADLAARAAAARAASAGTATVRLGTFSTRDAALNEWSRIAAGIPGGTASRTRIVERASIAGQAVHRLKASGFASLGEAQRFCASIAVRNADCSAQAAN